MNGFLNGRAHFYGFWIHLCAFCLFCRLKFAFVFFLLTTTTKMETKIFKYFSFRSSFHRRLVSCDDFWFCLWPQFECMCRPYMGYPFVCDLPLDLPHPFETTTSASAASVVRLSLFNRRRTSTCNASTINSQPVRNESIIQRLCRCFVCLFHSQFWCATM